MTDRDDRVLSLREADESIAKQCVEDLGIQGRHVAANMLMTYTDKTCLTAAGFIYCVQQAHEVALPWLISEGWVTLTQKGTAAADELEARKKKPLVEEATNVADIRRGGYA